MLTILCFFYRGCCELLYKIKMRRARNDNNEAKSTEQFFSFENLFVRQEKGEK